MESSVSLSIVIPVGPGELAWEGLLSDLAGIPCTHEILLVGTGPKPTVLPKDVQWIEAQRGRAQQLNAGARLARYSFLWFLHADTRLGRGAVPALLKSLEKDPTGLHYFDLRFASDGPALMQINRVGVWIRSHGMGLPFGDQGFCLSQVTYGKLGGFKEGVPFGEDHLLVWSAHQQSVPLLCTGTWIETSARKYRERGWLRNTLATMIRTADQAFPELWKLIQIRTKSRLPREP